jgi:hypothetical protein
VHRLLRGAYEFCTVTVLKNEQFPEDGEVRPKVVAVDYDFNVNLN